MVYDETRQKDHYKVPTFKLKMVEMNEILNE